MGEYLGTGRKKNHTLRKTIDQRLPWAQAVINPSLRRGSEQEVCNFMCAAGFPFVSFLFWGQSDIQELIL